jgi:LysR family transcriptional regulator of beta-lactamase
MQLPLNAMRAFEASARHLSFTRAALELHVTQNAVSAQVKNLEARLGTPLFRRLPRGLALTDEGQALLPLLTDSFERMHAVLEQFEGGLHRQVVTVAVVGTFAVGWLLPRLPAFQRAHPAIDLRLMTNNNRVDLAAEGLDWAIRFGDGAWHGTEARPLIAPPLSPVCAPAIARRLRVPADLARETLLRSYRPDEWARWFEAARVSPPLVRGAIFDSSITMAAAAAQGAGIALLPTALFGEALRAERLVQPFDVGVTLGRYWLTRLKSRPESDAMRTFAEWLQARIAEQDTGATPPGAPGA